MIKLSVLDQSPVSDGYTSADALQNTIELARLADRYADQKPDLADLCLVRMSELFPKHSVLTTDRTDFQVYRRNKREAIPILCPPER